MRQITSLSTFVHDASKKGVSVQLNSPELNSSVRPDQIRSLGLLPEQIQNSPELFAHSQRFLEEFQEVRGGLRDSSWHELQSKWAQFFNYCITSGKSPLPAAHDDVFEYIKLRSQVLHRSTLKRDMWAINRIHHASGFKEPCKDQVIKDFVKRVSEEQAANGLFITQAEPLLRTDLDEISEKYRSIGTTMALRDRAILGLMFSCLLRSSELRNVKYKHLNLDAKQLLIPISKTNHSGEPDIAPISKNACLWITEYLSVAGIFKPEDYIFRGLSKYGSIFKSGKKQMSHDALVEVFSRAFEVVQYRKKNRRSFSCHSTRVGCCQALWEAGFKLERIMLLGRWSTQEMAYRYGRGFKVDGEGLDSIM